MKKHQIMYALLLALLVFAHQALVAGAQQTPPPLPSPFGGSGANSSCIESTDPPSICLPSPSGIVELWDLYGRIFAFARFVAAAAFVIVVLVGAFNMMMARGNETKFKDGLKTIRYAVIGAAIIMVAGGIINVIKEFLSK